MDNALQRLENVTLEETRMTSAEAFKTIHGVKDMIQGVTEMLQGVDDRVKDIKIINSAQTVHLPMSMLSLSVWLGVEKTGQQMEDHIDIVTVEGLGGVGGGAVNVDEVRSAVKNDGSRVMADVASDGALVFLTNHLHHPKRLTCLDRKMTPPRASDFDDLSRS
jgi:hypothetical protein